MFRNTFRLGMALFGILALSYGLGAGPAQAADANGGRFVCKITRPNGIVMVAELFGYELKDVKAYHMSAYKDLLADWDYGAREWADVVKEGNYPVPKPTEPDVKVLEEVTGKDDKARAAVIEKYRPQLENWGVYAITDFHGNTTAQAVRNDYQLRAQVVEMNVYAKAMVAYADVKAKVGEKAAGAVPQVPVMKKVKDGLKSFDEAQKAAKAVNDEIVAEMKKNGKPLPDPNPPSVVKMERAEWPGLATVYTGADWGGDETFITAIKEADFTASGCPDWKVDQLAKRDVYAYDFLWAHEAPTVPAKHRYNDRLLCYYLGDRIRPSRWGGLWAVWEAQAYAADPHHPAVFSMAPREFGGLELYFPIVRGRAVCYYHYHWDAGRSPEYHFVFLEQYRQQSAMNGYAPIARLTEARPEDMRKTSQTIFTSLAYGVRGFVYGGGIFDGNKRDARGVPTRNAYGVAEAKINKAIRAFSPVFLRARNVNVFQTAPLPLWAKEAPADYWVRPSGAEVVMGEFADRYNRYLVVANRDAFKAHEATLTFIEDGLKVSKMNKDTREWQDLTLKKENGKYSIVIPMEEAGCDLVRVIGHRVPPVITAPEQFINRATVRMTTGDPSVTIHYTLDGSEPTKKSSTYSQPITVKKTGKIRAVVVDKDGRASGAAEVAVTKVEPKKADGKTLGPGVGYEYYEGAWQKLPAFETLKPVMTGVTKTVSLDASRRSDNYALRFTGYIEITTAGSYTFSLGSDDGSRLFVDGEMVLEMDGVHGVAVQKKPVELKAGMHKVVVQFFQGGGGVGLQLGCTGPDGKAFPLSFWCGVTEE